MLSSPASSRLRSASMIWASVATAISAGLLAGDELVTIAGDAVTGDQPYDKVTAATSNHKGETVPIVVRRDEAELTLDVPISDAGLMGVGLVEGEVVHRPASFGHSAKMAVLQPFVITQKQLKGLYYLITGKIDAKVSGPVGIVKEIARSAEKGVIDLFFFAAGISTLLGLFNLLPLPALDGGRLVFLSYEMVTRRRANPKLEATIHMVGVLVLAVLLVVVTVNDCRHL